MGLPMESVDATQALASSVPQLGDAQATRAAEQLANRGPEFMAAPLSLGMETYEGFARLLPHLGGHEEGRASVEEELRQRGIDPEVFFRNQQRLDVRRFSPDDHDPTSLESEMAEALGIEEPGDSGDRLFVPPARGGPGCKALAEVLALAEKAEREGKAPPNLGLNVPQGIEEIELDEGVFGGRMSCETPKDLTARLQIDSLTDDGEDDDFRQEVIAADEGGEDDVIEAFSLDPEFDYDNVPNRASKFGCEDGEEPKVPSKTGEADVGAGPKSEAPVVQEPEQADEASQPV